jgi:hypothetical protein
MLIGRLVNFVLNRIIIVAGEASTTVVIWMLPSLFILYFHCLYSPPGPWPLLFQFHDHFTDGRTP